MFIWLKKLAARAEISDFDTLRSMLSKTDWVVIHFMKLL